MTNEIETIFDNLDEYSDCINVLVEKLKQCGINSYDEFIETARELEYGPVKKSMREQIKEHFDTPFVRGAAADVDEDNDWQNAMTLNTEQGYLHFLAKYPESKYRDTARERYQNCSQPDETVIVPDGWTCVDKNDAEAIKTFVNENPDSPHFEEACARYNELLDEKYRGRGIESLTKEIDAIIADPEEPRKDDVIYERIVEYLRDKRISKAEFLTALNENNNYISAKVAKKLNVSGHILDYRDAGIDDEFIKLMRKDVTPKILDGARPLRGITKRPCTEVYFWGIPSSGKSCAIGAIASAANNGNVAKSMIMEPKCQGYQYLYSLSDLFDIDHKIGILPERTQATLVTTYEMGFDLEDHKEKVHPITIIDIAGEVFCDMYKYLSKGQDALASNVYDVLASINDIFISNRTENRKIHFFVIEYGAEDRKYMDTKQATYLQSAVEYINMTGIFKKDTDAVYILVTKVDKAKAYGAELMEHLKKHITSKYAGFYNGLKKICTDNEINGGAITVIPFSLGEVCFQYYCKFDTASADKVVKEIMDRSYGYPQGKLNKIKGKLKA
jgi:hypothetical protein